MRKTVATLMLFLVLMAGFPSFVNLASAAPSYPEVWVDDDAPASWYDANHVQTIADAVSIVSPGGIIHVLPGTYEPSNVVLITKPLSMIGEDYPVIRGVLSIRNTENVTILGIHFTHPTDYSLLLARNSTNITLKNNIFGPMPHGKPVYMKDVHNILFQNNTFRDNYYEGVTIEGTNDNLTFLENLFMRNVKTWGPFTQGTLHIHGETSGLVIMDNVFINNSMNDILVNYRTVTRVVIENNTFIGNNTKTAAIKVRKTPGAIIRGNTISGYRNGMRISRSDGVVIEDNIVSDVKSFGIFVLSLENGVIRDNKVSKSLEGIHFRDVISCTAEGNEILDSSLTGIDSLSTINTSMIHNTLIGNYIGINVQSSQNTTLTKNVVINGNVGIKFYRSTGGNVTQNIIHNNSQGVFVYNSSGIEVHYSSIVGNNVGVESIFPPTPSDWVNATLNWWGAEDGPSALPRMRYIKETPTGTGDPVTNYVYFDPWIGKTPSVVYSSLSVSRTQVSPGENITVSSIVQASGPIPTNYTAELKVNGKVTDHLSGFVFPGEPQPLSFTISFKKEGTYYVTIDGLKPIKVVVKGTAVSETTNAYTMLSTISKVWTNLFFLQDNHFKETYQKAQEEGVDNKTLKLASEIYENATKLILHAWKTDNIEELRDNFWTMNSVFPIFYETRKAFLEIKRAIEILEEAMK